MGATPWLLPPKSMKTSSFVTWTTRPRRMLRLEAPPPAPPAPGAPATAGTSPPWGTAGGASPNPYRSSIETPPSAASTSLSSALSAGRNFSLNGSVCCSAMVCRTPRESAIVSGRTGGEKRLRPSCPTTRPGGTITRHTPAEAISRDCRSNRTGQDCTLNTQVTHSIQEQPMTTTFATPTTDPTPAPKRGAMFWAGWVLTVLLSLTLAMGGVMNVTRSETAVKGLNQYGYPPGVLVPLGVVLLVSVTLYL